MGRGKREERGEKREEGTEEKRRGEGRRGEKRKRDARKIRILVCVCFFCVRVCGAFALLYESMFR